MTAANNYAPADFDLVLLAARPTLTQAQQAQLRQAVSEGIDWKPFNFRVNQGQVQTLAYRNLLHHCRDLLTEPVVERLRAIIMRRTEVAMQYLAALHELVSAAESQGVSIITYKGPTLAQQAYGDFHLRTFVDVDVLVHEADLLTVCNILYEQGYVPTQPVDLSSREHQRAKHYIFNHPQRQTSIEVHWRFKRPQDDCVPLNVDDVMQRTKPLTIQNFTFSVPSLEDNLLILANHGNQHVWSRLKWIMDVAYLLEKNTVNWDVLLQRAEATASRRVVLLTLMLCHEIFATPLPDHIANAIAAERGLRWAADFVMEQFYIGREGELLLRQLAFLLYMEQCWQTRFKIPITYFRNAYTNFDHHARFSLQN